MMISDEKRRRLEQERVYLEKEQALIVASKESIQWEWERLEADSQQLAPHIYEEVGWDLIALSRDLTEREASYKKRLQQYRKEIPVWWGDASLRLLRRRRDSEEQTMERSFRITMSSMGVVFLVLIFLMS